MCPMFSNESNIDFSLVLTLMQYVIFFYVHLRSVLPCFNYACYYRSLLRWRGGYQDAALLPLRGHSQHRRQAGVNGST